jgi:hypothetical protein
MGLYAASGGLMIAPGVFLQDANAPNCARANLDPVANDCATTGNVDQGDFVLTNSLSQYAYASSSDSAFFDRYTWTTVKGIELWICVYLTCQLLRRRGLSCDCLLPSCGRTKQDSNWQSRDGGARASISFQRPSWMSSLREKPVVVLAAGSV